MSTSPEIWRGTVERLGWGGHGLARSADGRLLMLRSPLALIPGEEVEARVVWKARHGEGDVLRWLTEDPRRIAPLVAGSTSLLGTVATRRTIQYNPGRHTKSSGQGARAQTGAICPVAQRCGGCSLWGADSALRGELKRQMAEDLLHRMLPGAPAWDWLPAPDTARRSRIQLHWDGARLGYFSRRSHELVVVSGCPMAADPLAAAIAPLAAALENSQLPPDAARWELATGTPAGDIAASAWGETWRLGAGAPAAGSSRSGPLPPRLDAAPLTHALGSHLLRQHPRAFFQVTPEWAWEAFGRIFSSWEVGGGKLFDLYSGGGFFSRLLGDRFQRCVLVEASPLSAADARANLLGLEFKLHQGDVAAGLAGQPADWAGPEDTVLLDPPRAGLPPEVCDSLRACQAGSIVLIGCDGAAFCRDVRRICEDGPWELKHLSVIDLFPNTPEVECVGLLSR